MAGQQPVGRWVNPFPTGELARIAENVERSAEDVVDANDQLAHQAFAFVREHPVDAMTLGLKKLVWTFHYTELPNAGDPSWEASHSWMFGVPGFPVTFGIVFSLALGAGVLEWNRFPRKALAGSFLAVGIATAVVFFTNGRFRLIMVPPLLIGAGLACDRFILHFTRVRLRHEAFGPRVWRQASVLSPLFTRLDISVTILAPGDLAECGRPGA